MIWFGGEKFIRYAAGMVVPAVNKITKTQKEYGNFKF